MLAGLYSAGRIVQGSIPPTRGASGLGDALYKCARYEEAVAAYRSALDLDAGSLEARRGLRVALGRWQRHAGR